MARDLTQRASRTLRSLPCLITMMALALGSTPMTAMASEPVADVAAFDRGFRAGQEEFNRGQYLNAARIWKGAANALPESAEHRENRQALHEYIAQAYANAMTEEADKAIAREGLAVLTAYANRFSAAYPTEPIPERITSARAAFRARLAENEVVTEVVPPVQPPPPVSPATVPATTETSPRPWKGLAIGGGVALAGGGAMLAMFAAGFVRARSATAQFNDPENACDLNNLAGDCAELNGQGRTSNAIAVAGLVTAPILIGTGVALLVVGMRRKNSNKALAPMLGAGVAGLIWHQKF